MRFFPVWQRNFLVWKKLAAPSILGNLADPLLYMLGLGYGLGQFLGEINGVPYLTFLAAGTLAYSVMNSATFETLYSAFSRMHVQKTWDAILNTPLSLTDILIGEWLWAASKSLLSGIAILVVIWALGLHQSFLLTLWLLPVIALTGLCFAGLGLAVNSPWRPTTISSCTTSPWSITPMVLLSGVFYPPDALPGWLAAAASALPLTHAIELARPLVLGRLPGAAAMARRSPAGLWRRRFLARPDPHPAAPAEMTRPPRNCSPPPVRWKRCAPPSASAPMPSTPASRATRCACATTNSTSTAWPAASPRPMPWASASISPPTCWRTTPS
jgi:lipooligosaccharide transport system permease protein